MARLILKSKFNIPYYFDGGRFAKGDYKGFVTAYYPMALLYALSRGLSDDLAKIWARNSTYQVAHESGYGSHVGANHNYGGMRANGKYISYKDMLDFVAHYGDNMAKKWPEAFNAKDTLTFALSLHTPTVFYSTRGNGAGYGKALLGVKNRVDKIINGIQ